MATEELTQLIDKLVQEKTFSLDAVGKIKELRDKATDLEQKLKLAQGDGETRRREIQNLENVGRRKDDEISAWAKRETELKAREAKMTDLEKSVAVEMAKAQVWDSCMSRMLANRTIREGFQSSVPLVMPPTYAGGPSTTTWQAESKNTTREEG